MAERSYALLAERGVLSVSGEDSRRFLQGLISNNIDKVGPDRAIYAALLTPQGKYLHDFFIAQADPARPDALLIDCERTRLEDLRKRLSLYKLRAKVELRDESDAYRVLALFGEGALAALDLPAEPGAAHPLDGGSAFTDPRNAGMGARAVVSTEIGTIPFLAMGFEEAEFAAYDRARLRLGLPDGSRDLPVEKAILLENNFEEMNGVDFSKGCYMGQELTARTKYRALIKKRLTPVAIDGPAPEPGTPLLLDGHEAGEMRSSREGLGLAVIRLDALEQAGEHALTAGAARVRPIIPSSRE